VPLSASQRPWPEPRQNDGGTLVVLAFPCRNEHWPQATTDRIYGMVRNAIRQSGVRPMTVQYDPIDQALIVVADWFNLEVSSQTVIDSVYSLVNTPTSYLAYHSHRPYGIDSTTHRYLGPLLPHCAGLTIYSRNHSDVEQMDRAVMDSFPDLRKLLKQARRTSITQIRCRYLVTLGRHGTVEMYGATVRAVNSALRKVCRQYGWTLILASCQPDHLHCVVDVPTDTTPLELARHLRGGTSKLVLAECPWTRRYAGATGVPLSFWDRSPEVRSAAVTGDHWKTLELYLRGQSARHGRRVVVPADQRLPTIHRTSRLVYGKALRRKDQRTPRNYFQFGKGSRRQVWG
jgi:REP element-mobilizing transposase RayT